MKEELDFGSEMRERSCSSIGTPIMAATSRRETFWKRGDTNAFHVDCMALLRAAAASSQCADAQLRAASKSTEAAAIFMGKEMKSTQMRSAFAASACPFSQVNAASSQRASAAASLDGG